MYIPPITSASTQAGEARFPAQTLGQEDFLKLLVTQMTSQDPLNPQKDTDFIAQMAQFTSLEQSRLAAGNLARLDARQEISTATALLGRTVTLNIGPETEPIQGVVTAIKTDGDAPRLVVGGHSYTLDQILNVSETITVGPQP